LRPGEQVRWTFALRCAGRQHLRLGGPHVRLWGPLGLTAAETRVRAPHTVAVYPTSRPSATCPVPSGRRRPSATTCRRRAAKASSRVTSVPSPPAIRSAT
jgi:uncharacterized protein (DUF58 family)